MQVDSHLLFHLPHSYARLAVAGQPRLTPELGFKTSNSALNAGSADGAKRDMGSMSSTLKLFCSCGRFGDETASHESSLWRVAELLVTSHWSGSVLGEVSRVAMAVVRLDTIHQLKF